MQKIVIEAPISQIEESPSGSGKKAAIFDGRNRYSE
jgi:hypothetical protein